MKVILHKGGSHLVVQVDNRKGPITMSWKHMHHRGSMCLLYEVVWKYMLSPYFYMHEVSEYPQKLSLHDSCDPILAIFSTSRWSTPNQCRCTHTPVCEPINHACVSTRVLRVATSFYSCKYTALWMVILSWELRSATHSSKLLWINNSAVQIDRKHLLKGDGLHKVSDVLGGHAKTSQPFGLEKSFAKLLLPRVSICLWEAKYEFLEAEN